MTEEVVAWTRETPWRQGYVLLAESAQALGLSHPSGAESTCVIVVSHDCDLAVEDLKAEPYVEVIVGCVPKKNDGNFSWAKSPRCLQLEVSRNNNAVVVELLATDKRLVSKQQLAAAAPDKTWLVSGKALATLRYWLAVRYNRVAFPDHFVIRFNQSKVRSGLARLVEPIHQNLSAIYFDVDKGQEFERSDGSAYELNIVLVFPPGADPGQTNDEMDSLAEKIEELFAKHHYDKGSETWRGIHLKSCIAISEDDLPVSKAKLMNEWRYEHMTLKDRDGQ